MKNVRNNLFGVIVPLVKTLFDDESFDQGAYEKQIEYCIESSMHGLFAMGSTGESVHVSRKVHFYVSILAGAVHIMLY